MSKKNIIVGIDTSNYTTSVAIVSADGKLMANLKRPLPVKNGECGLRQSEAVFAHIKNIPSIMREAGEYIGSDTVVAVGVSERPRNVDGSYMPCFLSGLAAAESISAATGAKLYRFSHQCGHIMAALYSTGRTDLTDSEFYAFHVSGGTTELVKVERADNGFKTSLIGGTNDLNAGQAIDRIGVMMGLPFPAGVYIEELALSNVKKIPSRKPSLDGTYVNLSGVQNLAEAIYKDSGDKALVSAFVLDHIGKALFGMRESCVKIYGDLPFVFAGGVMSNTVIKGMLAKENSFFAEPEFSKDNAVGVAYLTQISYNREI